MFDSRKISSLLTKSIDDADVAAWLSHVGCKTPRLKKGEPTVSVDLPKAGLQLAFADEAFHMRRSDLALGEGALLFVSVTFVSSNIPSYIDYPGDLPHGLVLRESSASVHANLGAPAELHDFLPQETWNEPSGLKLFVTYEDDSKAAVEQVSLESARA